MESDGLNAARDWKTGKHQKTQSSPFEFEGWADTKEKPFSPQRVPWQLQPWKLERHGGGEGDKAGIEIR